MKDKSQRRTCTNSITETQTFVSTLIPILNGRGPRQKSRSSSTLLALLRSNAGILKTMEIAPCALAWVLCPVHALAAFLVPLLCAAHCASRAHGLFVQLHHQFPLFLHCWLQQWVSLYGILWIYASSHSLYSFTLVVCRVSDVCTSLVQHLLKIAFMAVAAFLCPACRALGKPSLCFLERCSDCHLLCHRCRPCDHAEMAETPSHIDFRLCV